MPIRDTRAGFTQAKFNEDASSFIIFEILVIAVAFGIGMQRWWWRDVVEPERNSGDYARVANHLEMTLHPSRVTPNVVSPTTPATTILCPLRKEDAPETSSSVKKH